MNILLLWTDQQRADTLSCYSEHGPRTPNLDSLAEDSTVFEQAYCTSPVCTPSRGSVMTGLYPHAHGAYRNNLHLHEDARCLPELLAPSQSRAMGYVGKWHLGDEIFAQHGFEEWQAFEDGYRAHYSANRDPEARSPYHHELVAKGYRPDPKNNAFDRDWCMKLPARDSKPAFCADHAMDFITRHSSESWLLSVNTLEPHHPLMGPLADAYLPDELKVSDNFCATGETDPLFVRLKQRRWREGFEDFHLKDETSWRLLMANYFGQMELVDQQYGRILGTLKQSGQYDNTLIIHCSDHGEQYGCHGLFGKGVPYQESCHIPLLIKWPGQKEQRRIQTPVSLVDLVPTVLETCGCDVPDSLHGQSLAWCAQGKEPAARDILIQWHGKEPGEFESLPDWVTEIAPAEQAAPAMNPFFRTIVTPEQWVYTATSYGEEILFDLNHDPGEMNNLAQQAGDESRLDVLRQRLKQAMVAVSDSMTQKLNHWL